MQPPDSIILRPHWHSLVLDLLSTVGVALLCIIIGNTFGSKNVPVAICEVLILSSVLYWMHKARRRFFRTFPPNRNWMRAAVVCLALSIFIPVAVAVGAIMFRRFFPEPEGWDGLSRFVWTVLAAYAAYLTSVVLCGIGFMIQLWRDQWRKSWMASALMWQAALFLAFAFVL